MNEKRIQQVLEIEKQANAIHDAAVQEAAQLPVQAEREAQALIEKARAEADQEARELVAKAHSQAEYDDIIAQAQEKIQRTENLAQSNSSRAVAYVVNRVVGREQL